MFIGRTYADYPIVQTALSLGLWRYRVQPNRLERNHERESLLGRYRIHCELAMGGMASVHLASAESNEGFSKLVALKCIHKHLSRDQDFIDMFLDEARIAARIDHANVCQVFDFGQTDGTYYLAMEYLMGETFRAVANAVRSGRGGRNHWGYVTTLIAQAAEGLHAAHELKGDDGSPLGLVHRDVSPQNLFVTYSGAVKVVDFGIARAEGQAHHTQPGTIKGKFSYIAPETLSARPVDRRADVWALGVTLWEMLTLQPLFKRGSQLETLTAVKTAPIRRPSTVNNRLPLDLDNVIIKALSRNPDNRYATAREFGRALRQVLRKHGEMHGAPDLEEWVQDLFPEQCARKEAQVQAIRESSAVRSSIGEIPSEVAEIHLGDLEIESEVDEVAAEKQIYRPPVPGERSPRARTVSAVRSRIHDDEYEDGLLDAPMPDTASYVTPAPLPPMQDASLMTPWAVHPPQMRSHRPLWVAAGVVIATLSLSLAYLLGRTGEVNAPPSVTAASSTPVVAPTAAAPRMDPPTATAVAPAEPAPAARKEAPAIEAQAAKSDAAARASATKSEDSDPSRRTNRARLRRVRDAREERPTVAETIAAPAVEPAKLPVEEPAIEERAAATEVSTPSAAPVAPAATVVPPALSIKPDPQPETAPTPSVRRIPALAAKVSIRDFEVDGSLPRSVVQRAIQRAHSKYVDCYSQIARKHRRDQSGEVTVRFILDENGMARRVSTSSGPLSGVGSCISESSMRIRSSRRPDTGSVAVSYTVRFDALPAREER